MSIPAEQKQSYEELERELAAVRGQLAKYEFAAEDDEFVTRLDGALLDVVRPDVAQPAGEHDGLVVAAQHPIEQHRPEAATLRLQTLPDECVAEQWSQQHRHREILAPALPPEDVQRKEGKQHRQ